MMIILGFVLTFGLMCGEILRELWRGLDGGMA